MALDIPQIDDMHRLWPEGRDVSEIARMTSHDRKTVREYRQMDVFSPEAPVPRAKGPSKLDPFKGWIDRTLEADLHEWRKQRHIDTRICGEIREMGYEGRYSLVRCYVRERKRAMRQAAAIQFASKYSNVVVQLAVSMVLARLLTPAECGTMAIVSVFMSFFSLLSDMGLSAGVV